MPRCPCGKANIPSSKMAAHQRTPTCRAKTAQRIRNLKRYGCVYHPHQSCHKCFKIVAVSSMPQHLKSEQCLSQIWYNEICNLCLRRCRDADSHKYFSQCFVAQVMRRIFNQRMAEARRYRQCSEEALKTELRTNPDFFISRNSRRPTIQQLIRRQMERVQNPFINQEATERPVFRDNSIPPIQGNASRIDLPDPFSTRLMIARTEPTNETQPLIVNQQIKIENDLSNSEPILLGNNSEKLNKEEIQKEPLINVSEKQNTFLIERKAPSNIFESGANIWGSSSFLNNQPVATSFRFKSIFQNGNRNSQKSSNQAEQYLIPKKDSLFTFNSKNGSEKQNDLMLTNHHSQKETQVYQTRANFRRQTDLHLLKSTLSQNLLMDEKKEVLKPENYEQKFDENSQEPIQDADEYPRTRLISKKKNRNRKRLRKMKITQKDELEEIKAEEFSDSEQNSQIKQALKNSIEGYEQEIQKKMIKSEQESEIEQALKLSIEGYEKEIQKKITDLEFQEIQEKEQLALAVNLSMLPEVEEAMDEKEKEEIKQE